MLKRAQKPKEAKEPKAKEPKQKARVKQILKEKVSKNKGHNTSEDLTKLTEEYNIFCMRLAGLVKVGLNMIGLNGIWTASYQQFF